MEFIPVRQQVWLGKPFREAGRTFRPHRGVRARIRRAAWSLLVLKGVLVCARHRTRSTCVSTSAGAPTRVFWTFSDPHGAGVRTQSDPVLRETLAIDFL